MTTVFSDESYGDGDDPEATLDPVDGMLVAYLDGELSAVERAETERRLVEDAGLRARLQELQGGWEMLDELPSVQLDDNFTHTTMEMVAAETMRELDHWSAKDFFRRFLRPFRIVLATLVCLAIGALFVRVSRRAEMQRQLNDLPLAEHLDGYLNVVDLDWMRMLAQNERWMETVNAAEAADVFGPMGLPPAESPLHQADTVQRAKLVEQMQPVEKERLLTDWRRFERLTPERREAVRRVAAEIENDPHRDELLRTIDAFARWKEALTSKLQDQIADAVQNGSREDRQAALQAGIEYTQTEWLRDSGRQLSDEDVDAIYEVMYAIAADWPDQFEALRKGREEDRSLDRLEALQEDYADEGFDDFESAALNMVYLRRFPRFRGGPGNREPSSSEILGQLSEDDFFMLRALLTDETREILDVLAPTPELQQETLLRWVREAVDRKTGRSESDQRTRLEKLQELDSADRQYVELSEPDELFQRLEWLHRREQWERTSGRSPSGSPEERPRNESSGPTPPRRGPSPPR